MLPAGAAAGSAEVLLHYLPELPLSVPELQELPVPRDEPEVSVPAGSAVRELREPAGSTHPAEVSVLPDVPERLRPVSSTLPAAV